MSGRDERAALSVNKTVGTVKRNLPVLEKVFASSTTGTEIWVVGLIGGDRHRTAP